MIYTAHIRVEKLADDNEFQDVQFKHTGDLLLKELIDLADVEAENKFPEEEIKLLGVSNTEKLLWTFAERMKDYGKSPTQRGNR